MAQYVHNYVEAMLPGQVFAGQLLGADIKHADRQTYAVNLTVLTLIGMVMKVISTYNPLITDAVWVDALNHALDADALNAWPADLLNPPAGI